MTVVNNHHYLAAYHKCAVKRQAFNTIDNMICGHSYVLSLTQDKPGIFQLAKQT